MASLITPIPKYSLIIGVVGTIAALSTKATAGV
jgi:hypothetical protein